MKKECEYTRKSLSNYLRGHLFRLQKMRVDRHLRSCMVCRSEFEALKRAEETRVFMKDFTPAKGVVERVTEGFSGLARLRKLFYRPLWIVLIIVFAAIVYSYVVTPRQFDLELDSIVKTSPVSAPAVSTGHSATNAAAPAAPAPRAAVSPATAPAVEPLLVTVTVSPENEKTALHRINEVIQAHPQLQKKKFSNDVRDITGTLAARELLALLNRIEESGRVSYSRKRFESVAGAQPIPFVMKLRLAARAAEKPASPVPPAPSPPEAEDAAPPDDAPAPSPDR